MRVPHLRCKENAALNCMSRLIHLRRVFRWHVFVDCDRSVVSFGYEDATVLSRLFNRCLQCHSRRTFYFQIWSVFELWTVLSRVERRRRRRFVHWNNRRRCQHWHASPENSIAYIKPLCWLSIKIEYKNLLRVQKSTKPKLRCRRLLLLYSIFLRDLH